MLYRFVALCMLVVATATQANIVITPIAPETPEKVYIWQKDRCDDDDLPDSPVRAFKSGENETFLFAAHFNNMPLVGADVDSVRPLCKSEFEGKNDPNPTNYDAKIWLQSFYTEDGKTVYALGSSDYHGIWFDNCKNPSSLNEKCWWSAITLAKSEDGGRSFNMKAVPNHIIARSPHKYVDDAGPPPGFFTISNIIKKDEFYYVTMFAQGYAEQKRGNCLVRTNDLSDARSWRAWSGAAFDRPFVDPTIEDAADPEMYACKPVRGIPGPIRSILLHEPSQQYIAVFSRPVEVNSRRPESVRIEFQYSTSTDLMNWSKPVTIMSYDSDPSCLKNLLPARYPSMLDPQASDMNYSTVGDEGYIYFTWLNSAKDCKGTNDRDLVRVPIRIQQSRLDIE